MPLTQAQLDAIKELLEGYNDQGEPDNINSRINRVIDAREDVQALVRIHGDVPDEAAITILAEARSRAKTAARSIVDLLTSPGK